MVTRAADLKDVRMVTEREMVCISLGDGRY